MLRNGAVVVARYLCDGAGDEQGDADSEQRICCAMMGEKSDKDDVGCWLCTTRMLQDEAGGRAAQPCGETNFRHGSQFSRAKRTCNIYETRKTHSPAASDIREREICCGLEGCIGKHGESVHRTKTTVELCCASLSGDPELQLPSR